MNVISTIGEKAMRMKEVISMNMDRMIPQEIRFIGCREEQHTDDMTQEVLCGILSTIGSAKPEQGGMLGRDSETGRIVRFIHDARAQTGPAIYMADIDFLNECLADWEELDQPVEMAGVIHSHPGGLCHPSSPDRESGAKTIRAMPQTLRGRMMLPIVQVNGADRCTIYPYDLMQDEHGGITLARSGLTVEGRDIACKVLSISEEMERWERMKAEGAVQAEPEPGQAAMPSREELFQRISGLVPLDVMQDRTVVVIGTGGAAEFCEELGRVGVGRFVLFDGDDYAAPNIATQGAYVDELGRNKAECTARRIGRVNPYAETVAVPRFLNDEISDEEFEELVGRERLLTRPETVLIVGTTDNLKAQDRTIRLALRYGACYLSGQVYAGGRGGECTFWYPGLTRACPRCALASRYENSEMTDRPGSSQDAALYATVHMNALKLHLAMGMLLQGTDSRPGREFEQIADRSLVICSFAPDLERELGLSCFSRVLGGLDAESRACLPTEQTVFLPVQNDFWEEGVSDGCPYCGGLGDPRIVKGLGDTRKPLDIRPLVKTAAAFYQPLPIEEREPEDGCAGAAPDETTGEAAGETTDEQKGAA